MQTNTLNITEARDAFTKLPEQLADAQFITILRNGRPVMAVVDHEYLDTLRETVEILSDTDAMRQLADSLDDIRNGRVVDRDEARRLMGLDDEDEDEDEDDM